MKYDIVAVYNCISEKTNFISETLDYMKWYHILMILKQIEVRMII